MSTFDVIDGSVIVPTDPEGHIELRLVGDTVFVHQWKFIRGPEGGGYSMMTSSMRIPLNAIRALEGEMELRARRAAASE